MNTKTYICNMSMISHDFLKQSINQTRKSIRDIDDSYNNEWDMIAELCQNSVDAIKKSGILTGNINITIDSRDKSIKVSDNGIGIPPDKLPYLLAPFSTDKENDETTIGEKGVGLTFTIFSCNDFYIKSGNENGVSEGRIYDALNWKDGFEETDLKLLMTESDDKFQGTIVELKKVKESSLFSLSFNQLKFVLRTKTAIGNTLKIWGDDFDINISLIHIDNNGKHYTEKIDYSYLLLTESLNKSTVRDIKEWDNFIKSDRSDKEKRKFLYGRIIFKKDAIERSGRIIKYWACFSPNRKTFRQMTVKHNIATDEQLDNNNFIEQFSYTTFNSSITASVKGMPTGITIEHPITGAQGSWPQIFILFEDSNIKFDIGRKSIHGRQAKIYKDLSKTLFSEFQSLAKHMSSDTSEAPKPEWDKDEIFASIKSLLPINYPNIKLQKTPRDQEASLVGLFYECIGNDIIKDILPLSSGYKRKYDLYAEWNGKNVVIEFKSKLKNILDDFESERKMFDEIDCVVCWNVDEEDKQVFKNSGISIDDIEINELIHTPNNHLPCATHELILPYVSPIYIIDMKILIENFNNNG